MMIVHSYDPTAKYPTSDKANGSVVVDLYVLDGGPLQYGDKQRPAVTPATHEIQTPAFFRGITMSGEVSKTTGSYAGTQQPVGGRFVIGTKVAPGNNAANLFTPLGSSLDPRAAEAGVLTEQLIDLLVAHRSGQFTPPEPHELTPAGPPPGAYPAYPGATSQPAYPQAPAQQPQVSYGPPPPAPAMPTTPPPPPAAPPAPLPRPQAFPSDAEWQNAWTVLSEADRAAWTAPHVPKAPPGT